MLDGFGGVGGHERVEDERPAWCSHVFEDVIRSTSSTLNSLASMGAVVRWLFAVRPCIVLLQYRPRLDRPLVRHVGRVGGLRVVEYFCE